MRKILYIVTGLDIGGAEKQITQLAIGLKKRGWEGHIITLITPQAFVDELEDNGINVTSLDLKRKMPYFNSLIELLNLIRKYRPTFIISFMFHANIIARVVGRSLKVPYIITSIRTEHFGGYHRYLIEKLLSKYSDLIVVNSNSVARNLINRNVIKSGKLAVIYNGIYGGSNKIGEDEKNEIRRCLGLGEDDYIWITVGRLEKRKNHKLLLGAFHILLKRKEAYLLIAGSGSLEDELKVLANRLGIQDRVRFLGNRDDVQLLLSASESFILSSRWEGMPNVILEAYREEVPVVATDVGGVSEIVINGLTGYLVKKNRRRKLAEAMINMMDLENTRRKEMGKMGRQIVLDRFLMDDIINIWERTLLNLINSNDG